MTPHQFLRASTRTAWALRLGTYVVGVLVVACLAQIFAVV